MSDARHRIISIAFSPDGTEIAAVTHDELKRWDAGTLDVLQEWTPVAEEGQILTLDYLRDGRLLLGLEDGSLRLLPPRIRPTAQSPAR
jgi:WD40 repeat protein